VHLFDGDGAVLDVTDKILEIAQRRPIVEVAYDPWRYHAEALRLERDDGLTLVEFPQSHARMTAASENLHAKIVKSELQATPRPSGPQPARRERRRQADRPRLAARQVGPHYADRRRHRARDVRRTRRRQARPRRDGRLDLMRRP